jgi:mono/diheme cytochrome c family protein
MGDGEEHGTSLPEAGTARNPARAHAPRSRRRWVSRILQHPWRIFTAGVVLGGGLFVAIFALIILPLAVGHRTDLPLERLYGGAAVSIAARLHAGNQPNPVAQNPRALEAGQVAYLTCAQCHGPTGKGDGVYGRATYPNATDLTTGDAKEKSDAELFWITKNGLSFTGMPGFAGQYSDQEIWQMVTYMRALQSGQAPVAAVIPTASAQQLAVANPAGTAPQQGAAVYSAQGCQTCHGAAGNAPGELGLRNGREATAAIRDGRRGMPAYGQSQLPDADLQKLIAYMNTFNNPGR